MFSRRKLIMLHRKNAHACINLPIIAAYIRIEELKFD